MYHSSRRSQRIEDEVRRISYRTQDIHQMDLGIFVYVTWSCLPVQILREPIAKVITVTHARSLKPVEKRLKILEWISAADFSRRHEAVSKERVENSGIWFLQSEAYQEWLNGNASNLLCYQGIRESVV
jgi:hypothetical protein